MKYFITVQFFKNFQTYEFSNFVDDVDSI